MRTPSPRPPTFLLLPGQDHLQLGFDDWENRDIENGHPSFVMGTAPPMPPEGAHLLVKTVQGHTFLYTMTGVTSSSLLPDSFCARLVPVSKTP